MRYRVDWVLDTRERLADLLAGGDPRIILAAARLDAILGTCPRSFGESRGDAPRNGFALPLGVWYEFDQDERVVRVLNVWRTDRRGPGDEPDDDGDPT